MKIAMVCPCCPAVVEFIPDATGFGTVSPHPSGHTPGKTCSGSNQVVRPPAPPRDCPTCGAALSLDVRSRQSVLDQRHRPAECIAALRARIERLEAAAGIL